ncbi:MAG: alkaline phosphatase D family protein, partial [Phycisphaerae bacterium]
MLHRRCVILAVLGPICALAAADTLPNGVAVGDVDQSSAVLWARSDVVGPITFEYGTDSTFAMVEDTVAAEVVDPLVPVKVEITGLSEATRYVYRAVDASGNGSEGRFRTSAGDGYGGLKFGVSGDWRGELAPYPAISNLPDRDLEFFVALGDTIYADFVSPAVPIPQARTLEEYRLKHEEILQAKLGLASWIDARASTSILAMIDDHEVTNDFAGGAPTGSDPRFDEAGDFLNETNLFSNGLQAFQEYHPVRDEFYGDTGDARTAGKRKLYRFRTYGHDACVIMLDARSFRDESLEDEDFDSTRAFMQASFDPSRTMLGEAQIEDLLADLEQCHEFGVTWKLIIVPEPIQNFGPVAAGDRFEGYGYERSRLLGFIDDNGIDNVAFIAADIHGTVVNNLVYQRSVDGGQIETTAFEVTTGAVAFDRPFGPALAESVPAIWEYYQRVPPNVQENLVRTLGNLIVRLLGYPAIGLERSPIDAKLIQGRYHSTNTYGWTEFEIDAVTQCLTVTTYGIDWYGEEELADDPDEVISRVPRIVSQFVVQPRLDRTDPDAPPPCFT